ncbi:MAG: adenylate/guanylate cyclase domain-containing protein [Emticicia sp.]|nr:adenylate/guanylate cyclase domain-containing protein [Emticicia sp.]
MENSSKDIEGNMGAQYGLYENYEKLAKGYEYAENYDLALFYLKKAIASKNVVFGQEKLKEYTDFESEYAMKIEKNRIKLEEETKRLELEKQIELKAIKFEFEKKQALAKTEEEKKRLVLEEELKRKLILLQYEEKQKEITLKFNQEKEIAKINQEKKDALAKAEIESSRYMKNMWALGMALSLALLGFAGFSYYQKQKDNKKIANEKRKSDELLLNILPHEVAEELKLNGESIAKHYDEVSVLFTDFVNFTQKSEELGVQKMLNELNVCFTAFDEIMEKYGLEKIKTIGDAYLAVSGLPTINVNHAQNAVNAGLEILEFISKNKSLNENSFEIRIGIHSGPVIAGIVGVKKFAYDIWGDTVNTAARMEQNGVKGKLNVSGSTYALISEKYNCEHRGKIETKGKGALDMYFISKSI